MSNTRPPHTQRMTKRELTVNRTKGTISTLLAFCYHVEKWFLGVSCHASVHHYGCSIDILRLIRSKEKNRRHKLFNSGHPAERRPGGQVVDEWLFSDQTFIHSALDESGCQ